MAVKHPAEFDFSNKKFMTIISGQPGMGKTTLALSAPDPFLFDTDEGISRIRSEHRCVASTVSSYEELLSDRESPEYKEAQTVVIDTGGTMVQLMKDWAKKKDAKAARDGRAMYGVIKTEFDRLCYQIRNQDQKHLVVVFHTTEQIKNDTIQTRLSCEGSTKDIVWTPADFGGHMFISGGKRMIGFTPTEEYFAKGCFGVSGLIEVPDLSSGRQNTFLTDLFARAQQFLRQESEQYRAQKEVYQRVMQQGLASIETICDPRTAAAATQEISSLEHALTSKAELRAAMSQKLKEVSLKYDKEAGCYVLSDDPKSST